VARLPAPRALVLAALAPPPMMLVRPRWEEAQVLMSCAR